MGYFTFVLSRLFWLGPRNKFRVAEIREIVEIAESSARPLTYWRRGKWGLGACLSISQLWWYLYDLVFSVSVSLSLSTVILHVIQTWLKYLSVLGPSLCLLAQILFLNCILLFTLLQLSPIFPPLPTSLQLPRPSGTPHTVVRVSGSYIYVLWLIPSPFIQYHPSLWHLSVCSMYLCICFYFVC